MRGTSIRAHEHPRPDEPPPRFARDGRSGALRSVDRALRDLGGRRFVSSAEVVDLLLDLRSAIVLDTALGQSSELEV